MGQTNKKNQQTKQKKYSKNLRYYQQVSIATLRDTNFKILRENENGGTEKKVERKDMSPQENKC